MEEEEGKKGDREQQRRWRCAKDMQDAEWRKPISKGD